MTITNNIVAKAAVAFVAVAMAFSLVAPAAQAQDVSSMSLEQLIALVNSLQTQLSGTAAATGNCSYTFTRSLAQGATGADVMNLQKFLNMSADTMVAASGAGSNGMETSYYGPATAAAVSKFQTKYSADILVPVGLTSPTGYFGPSTMAKANAVCAGMTGGTGTGTGSTSGNLEGGAGTLDETQFMSGLNNEEVGEGQEDVEVAGLEITPDNSDIALTAVKLTFDHAQGTEASGSATRFDKYADEVSLWLDGEEVARIDADEFSKDSTGIYSKTLTLKNAVIRDGDMGELVVAVSAANNIDSTDAGEEWGVKFASIRYQDAQGAYITDSTSTDVNTYRTFSFEDFATASDQKFRVRSGDSSINTARTIEISETAKTDGEAILSFNVEVEGDSDMNLDVVIVDWAASNATTSGMVTAAQLYMDGDRVGSESISLSGTSGVITFDDLDIDLDAGDTYEFEVRVDIAKTSAGYVSGSTFSIDVASSTDWTVEDENGDTVASGKRTGSASSDDHKLVTEGANLALGTVSTKEVYNSTTPSASYGEFRMQVEVTSVGDTIWVKEGAASSTTVTTGAGFSVVDSSGNIMNGGSATTTASFSYVSGGTYNSANSSYEIGEGQTATFELVVTHNAEATGQFRVVLNSIGFGTTVAGTGSTTTASPSTDFRSGLQAISN